MPDTFSLEIMREVWNDKTGEHWEIGPDRDATGSIEIRFKDENNKILDRMMFPTKEAAELIAKAILDCAKEIKD